MELPEDACEMRKSFAAGIVVAAVAIVVVMIAIVASGE